MKKKLNKIKILFGKNKKNSINFSSKFLIKPTKCIIKKSLFNLLGNINNFKCLDLFAGTGSLGIEALSKGAKKVYFIEIKKKILKSIKKNTEKLKINKKSKFINESYKKFIKKNKSKFDLIFIDPPFKFNKNKIEIIKKCKKILNVNGIIYFEEYKNNFKEIKIKNIKTVKIGTKGKVIYYLLKKC